jgi:GTP-binding protein
MADIPGLIEGASEGVGLGHQFLKHIERCRVLIHIVDAACTEGRDAVQDIYNINKELEAYNSSISSKPWVIAANKLDTLYGEEKDIALQLIKDEFEPQGIKVFPISAVSGEGITELLYYVNDLLKKCGDKPIVFEKEFYPEALESDSEPYFVSYDENEKEYVIEGPRIEKMLGYTNLYSEKGFEFFQNFMRTNGILDELESMGIKDGDTVRIYGWSFDYYK